jgi:hypothetical protein
MKKIKILYVTAPQLLAGIQNVENVAQEHINFGPCIDKMCLYINKTIIIIKIVNMFTTFKKFRDQFEIDYKSISLNRFLNVPILDNLEFLHPITGSVLNFTNVL